ncbi:tetratricopeptide repeat protein [Microbacterium sp. KSW4-11]|uniref:Tetratricopeptide repeat protein n=1 Tax=Microbacterium gawkjiense TaxID=3067309 RepID=A0ABU3G631_9MICO|nr:tetratricopeptide repeat protein [Microbacterium sp. KSW4-11]MDT3315258.1 tetratricopeptide repeat protein [Microbacterium sp. KSW4-11]
MRTRIGVGIVAVVLVLYIALVAQRAVLLVASGDPVGIAMGIALVLLPVVAVWALWRELSFGLGAQRLGRRLEAEGGLPEEELSLRPSGRPVQAEAHALFPAYRDAVERDPDDWRAWYRMGLLYDGAGDRRRARSAIRTAISRERADRRG